MKTLILVAFAAMMIPTTRVEKDSWRRWHGWKSGSTGTWSARKIQEAPETREWLAAQEEHVAELD
jgi:hypothetical protein